MRVGSRVAVATRWLPVLWIIRHLYRPSTALDIVVVDFPCIEKEGDPLRLSPIKPHEYCLMALFVIADASKKPSCPSVIVRSVGCTVIPKSGASALAINKRHKPATKPIFSTAPVTYV